MVCSTIRPTYRLSYDSVAELLLMHVEEEAELYLLAEVAKLRRECQVTTRVANSSGNHTSGQIGGPFKLVEA